MPLPEMWVIPVQIIINELNVNLSQYIKNSTQTKVNKYKDGHAVTLAHSSPFVQLYKKLKDLQKKYTRYQTYFLYNVCLKHILLLINNELQVNLCFH